jgi:hypothetical protein
MCRWCIEYLLRRGFGSSLAVGVRRNVLAAGNKVGSCRRYLLIVALIVGVPLSAQAGERLESIYLVGKRPAGLYAAVLQFNPIVCQAALDSLNKEFSISDDRLDDNPRSAVVSDLLLHSDLQLPWRRTLVRQSDAEVFKLDSIDFASGTLGSRFVNFYRRNFEIHGEAIGDLPINSLMISTWKLPAMESNQTLDERGLKKLRDNEVRVNVGELKQTKNTVNFAAPPSQRSSKQKQVLLNVIAVSGQTFILATDAVEAEVDGPKSGSQICSSMTCISRPIMMTSETNSLKRKKERLGREFFKAAHQVPQL